jgi:hypothetical protein
MAGRILTVSVSTLGIPLATRGKTGPQSDHGAAVQRDAAKACSSRGPGHRSHNGRRDRLNSMWMLACCLGD